MTRVLHVLVSTRAGGGPQHVMALATGLRAYGWEALAAGPPGGPFVERFRAAGVTTIALRTDRLRPFTAVRLARVIRAHGIRLVHSHGKGAGLYARIVARVLGIPAVHTLHGIHYEGYGRVGRAVYLALERKLSGWSRYVVNVSHAQEAEGLALGLFAPARSRVVLNGIDAGRLNAEALERADARAELGLSPTLAVVGCAARFDEVKRLDLLLRAVAGMRDPAPTLVLIGGGEEERRLRALASSLALGERVRFAGEIPDAARLFAAFDVYAAPSRKEGLPLGVLEAMALGLPVIASDIAAHREVLGRASLGLVPGTVEAFATALGQALRQGPRRVTLGRENRTRARSEFSTQEMLAGMDAVYREALGV